MRGYRSTRDISDDALALIPMFLLIRGMAVIGWISQRPELDTSEYFQWLRETRLRPVRDVRAAVLNACAATGAGFLTAVLWFDLMFDVQTRKHRSDVLPNDVLASIGAYYRRVTTDATPMNRLISLVMLATLSALVAEIAIGETPRLISWTSLAFAAGAIGLAAARTVRNAVRLGGGRDAPDAADATGAERSIAIT